MPRDLYELMLDALRGSQASAVVPAAVAPVVEAPPTPKTPPVTAPPAVDIPRAVSDAIAMYAFGDPVEEAANYTRAVALLKAGRKPADIVREIRQGANPETFV